MRLLSQLLLLLPLLASAQAAATVVVSTDPATGQLSWSFEEQGLGFQLLQLHPDFVAAFYGARGINKDVVQHMAGLCVFGTIVRNIADTRVSYRVSDWRYTGADGKQHSVTGKSHWVARWADMGSGFKWSLLPDDQVFAVGDWNQGFTVLELPHGAVFDLQLRWQRGEQSHTLTLKEVRCAPASAP